MLIDGTFLTRYCVNIQARISIISLCNSIMSLSQPCANVCEARMGLFAYAAVLTTRFVRLSNLTLAYSTRKNNTNCDTACPSEIDPVSYAPKDPMIANDETTANTLYKCFI